MIQRGLETREGQRMERRREELEKKRARLAELRRVREDRKKDVSDVHAATEAAKEPQVTLLCLFAGQSVDRITRQSPWMI